MKKIDTAPAYSPLWKKLYSLGREFVRAEPWNLFENEDVFVVQGSSDDQLYLCAVMGNVGREFGLNAFRGTQGMRNFYEIVGHEEAGQRDRDLKYEIDMLSFSLSSREFLDDNDLKVTRKLMMTFPGGKWPLFRSFRPHYHPWYLTEQEIESLCDCLEQTLVLHKRGEQSLDDIRNNEPEHMLVRSKEGGTWNSHSARICYPAKEETPEIRLDDITARRLLKLPDNGPKEEIDLVHLPGAITDHEPPYHGLLLIGINEEQFANQYGVFAPFNDYFQEGCDELAQAFLSRGAKPRTVLLRDDSPFADVFEGIAGRIGIGCERIDDLPYIADFLSTMERKMADGTLPGS